MFNVTLKTSKGDTVIQISALPEVCPFCKYSISPIFKSVALRDISSEDIADMTLKCTNRSCQHVFTAEFVRKWRNADYIYDFRAIPVPHLLRKTTFPALIEAFSSEFIIIYNQAEYAEISQLDKIAGMGYRKALEFLVKDYLINEAPDDAETIKKIMLGPAIQKINDTRIKSIAERATWLGNDETHYVRKWLDKDVNDLKALIKLVVHFIEAELLYKETIASMPK